MIEPGDQVECVTLETPCGCPPVGNPVLPTVGARYWVLRVYAGRCSICGTTMPCLAPTSPDIGSDPRDGGPYAWPQSWFSKRRADPTNDRIKTEEPIHA